MFELIDTKRLAVLKRKRRRMALAHKVDNTKQRLRVRELSR